MNVEPIFSQTLQSFNAKSANGHVQNVSIQLSVQDVTQSVILEFFQTFQERLHVCVCEDITKTQWIF